MLNMCIFMIISIIKVFYHQYIRCNWSESNVHIFRYLEYNIHIFLSSALHRKLSPICYCDDRRGSAGCKITMCEGRMCITWRNMCADRYTGLLFTTGRLQDSKGNDLMTNRKIYVYCLLEEIYGSEETKYIIPRNNQLCSFFSAKQS